MCQAVRRLGDVEPRPEILPGSPEPLLRLGTRQSTRDADRRDAVQIQADLPDRLGRLRQAARGVQQGMEWNVRVVISECHPGRANARAGTHETQTARRQTGLRYMDAG